MKITNFKILRTRLGTTLHHCRLILETETEPGTKSRFQYLCPEALYSFLTLCFRLSSQVVSVYVH